MQKNWTKKKDLGQVKRGKSSSSNSENSRTAFFSHYKNTRLGTKTSFLNNATQLTKKVTVIKNSRPDNEKGSSSSYSAIRLFLPPSCLVCFDLLGQAVVECSHTGRPWWLALGGKVWTQVGREANLARTCARPRSNKRANYRRKNRVKRNWWSGRRLWQATGKGPQLPVRNQETRDPRGCNIHVVLR